MLSPCAQKSSGSPLLNSATFGEVSIKKGVLVDGIYFFFKCSTLRELNRFVLRIQALNPSDVFVYFPILFSRGKLKKGTKSCGPCRRSRFFFKVLFWYLSTPRQLRRSALPGCLLGRFCDGLSGFRVFSTRAVVSFGFPLCL